MDENKNTSAEKKQYLTDRDFYEQACAYFYYHAEQRTTMINYFIAVFAACIALYGSLLSEYTLASMLIALFLFVVSFLFFMIDLRNKFDVKKSENVIRQFERDYGVDKPVNEYAYGVFSNETNIFKYYGVQQRMKNKKKYKVLKRLRKKVIQGKESQEILDNAIKDFIAEDKTVSFFEVSESLNQASVLPLSLCIKLLYIVCMIIGVLAFFLAALLLVGVF